jgi:small subunit ribosomal protein S14
MKYLLEKDKKNRKKFKKIEWSQTAFKSLINNRLLKNFNNLVIEKEFYFRTKQFASVSKIKNRCVNSNRAKSVYRFCKLSRIKFKESALKGFLPGVRKSSW